MYVLNRVGGLLHFPISKDLLILVKGAREQYHADLEAKKKLQKKQKVSIKLKITQARNHKTCEL